MFVRNKCHDGVDGYRFALGDTDLGHHSGGGGRNLGVNLVRRDLEERLVAVDSLTDLLVPTNNRALGDGFAKLRH